MHIAYYFMRSADDMDVLAALVKSGLNLADYNPEEHSRAQKRHGINYGGHYYLFTGFGLDLYVLKNAGINEEDAPFECRHYLLIRPAIASEVDRLAFRGMCSYLAVLLQEKGIEGMVQFDALSS